MNADDCALCPGVCPHNCQFALRRHAVIEVELGAAHEPEDAMVELRRLNMVLAAENASLRADLAACKTGRA